MRYMKVIQVDQWASTGNIKDLDFDTVSRPAVVGGDATTAVELGIASLKVLEVSPEAEPPEGFVWYKRGADGKCEYHDGNYDTSD
jgi:hypothetical protein